MPGNIKGKSMELRFGIDENIRVIVVKDPANIGMLAADIVEPVIRLASTEGVTICFATGSSPFPLYKELVRRHREKNLSFEKVSAFLLDEYYDLPVNHPQSFRKYMQENLYNHVDINPKNIHFFEGPAEDHMRICYEYERKIREAGGIDMMILGVGSNGHIAFNEPGTFFDSRTRFIRLSESTRRSNIKFFGSLEKVPHFALSIGVANIMEARRIILVAVGPSKAEAIRRALKGPVDPEIPASYLQKFEGDCVLVLDEDAASKII